MRWAGCVIYMGEVKNAYRILVRKPEGKRPLRKPKCEVEEEIKMDLVDTGWAGMDWVHLGHDKDQWQALLNTVTNLQIP
jgi:hypothetical protein